MRYSLKALGRQGVVQLQIDAEDADQARRQAMPRKAPRSTL